MLYALADHNVIDSMLPGLVSNRIGTDAAVECLHDRHGMIPVAIDPAGAGTIYFADIGEHPFHEWKFIYTIERLAKQGRIEHGWVTGLDLLERSDLPDDGIEPFALLFHVSRCGSTLLTKSLARLPENLTINQGGPLQEGFWSVITDGFSRHPEISPENIRRLRRLVLLMTRNRGGCYQRAFVKFISWNIIYFDLIRTAFPEAAVLYLYRDPAEVIATIMQETTAVLRARGKQQSFWLTGRSPRDTGKMDDIEYLSHCYGQYFKIAAAKSPQTGLRLLNYRELKQPGMLADIMARGLGLRLSPAEIRHMAEQYRYDSKDDSGNTIFIDDTSARLRSLTETQHARIESICAGPLQALECNSGNLYPVTGKPARDAIRMRRMAMQKL